MKWRVIMVAVSFLVLAIAQTAITRWIWIVNLAGWSFMLGCSISEKVMLADLRKLDAEMDELRRRA